MRGVWVVRPESAADVAAVREVNLAAFPTAEEADLVDALRADPSAWIEGLSLVAVTGEGLIVGHALLSRCHIGEVPALCLAPCAVRPQYQRQGAGSEVIRAALRAAADRGEQHVVVLGEPAYYRRFGFTTAKSHGIGAPIEVPDEYLMATSLDASSLPGGTIRYAAAFGI